MDVVLEVTDYFVGDYFYAWAHPLKSPPYSYNASALSSDPGAVESTWQYEPAAHFMRLEPSEAAYMSAWDRSNIYRQAFSLFMVTWYVGNPLYRRRGRGPY